MVIVGSIDSDRDIWDVQSSVPDIVYGIASASKQASKRSDNESDLPHSMHLR
jgi:hypothetical protein